MMKKTLLTIILICSLLFVSAFQEADLSGEDGFMDETDLIYEQDYSYDDGAADINSDFDSEIPTDSGYYEPTDIPTPEPTAEPVQTWQGIDEYQVSLLQNLYNAMTSNGQNYSGWFRDYNPCAWNGVTCENGVVTGLRFENLAYFTTFPEEILAFSELKTLTMKNILTKGPLPEDLFKNLPKLEELILEGNLLTGTIPELPEAFAVYPMLKTIHIAGNLLDDDSRTMLTWAEYADAAAFTLDPLEYPDLDLEPGLDGGLPKDWNRLPLLTDIDLSGNMLSGDIPENWAELPLTELNLEDGGTLTASGSLYQNLASRGLNLAGVINNTPVELPTETPTEVPTEIPPEIPTEVPTEIPTEVPTEIPTEIPTEVPTEAPVYVETIVPPTAEPAQPTAAPTAVPTAVPTGKPSKPSVIYVVVTATPVPQRWYTATPYPVYSWNVPQPGQNQPPQPQPYQGQPQQGYVYPTATPYNGGYLVYPTATPYNYSEPRFATATAVPTEDLGKQMGFTYVLEEMTESVIPMTWRYTGLTEYAIYFYDLAGSLYPSYAMNWTKAADICTSSECNYSITMIPDDLLNGGGFSLQLNAKDSAGNVYRSDFVTMQVSAPEPTPTPTPEPEVQRSFLSGFFHWLFGPIIRLFGGK